MKIGVLIMAADCEPSISNVETMKNTFIKYAQENNLRNTYDFLIYHGISDNDDIADTENCTLIEEDTGHNNGNVYRIIVPTGDYIYRTFEKTIYALEYIDMQGMRYDLYVRINISSYVNIHMLDRFADKFDEDTVYCNAINAIVGDDKYLNDLCPRGDFYIFSEKVRKGIVDKGKKYLYLDTAKKNRINVDHVDDVMVGISLIDFFGIHYYRHLKMLKYNYFPYNNEDFKTNRNITLDYRCICTRVKTVPPGETYSGYSWDDNEWRRQDCTKMEKIDQLFNTVPESKYDSVTFESQLVDEKTGRPTLMTYINTETVDKFYKYLDCKKDRPLL